MGTKGREIVGPDVKEIIGLLNRALADEWQAYYQYWVGAKIVSGPMRPDVKEEMVQHSKEELGHAEMVADRIAVLGGVPILNPGEWAKASNCAYDAPADHGVMAVLRQNIKAEQCAIGVYQRLLGKAKDAGDHITFDMARKIMEDEVGHEDELQELLEDIELMKK